MNDVYVYVLFRLDGHPFYVGKGRRNRWLYHERDVRRGLTKCYKSRIISQILEKGQSVPKVKVAEGLCNDDACSLEQMLIAAIGRYPNGPLANQTDGGEGVPGRTVSEYAKRRTSEANTGRRWSAEERARIAEATRCAMQDPACVAKMRAAKVGKPQPAKSRAKKSESLKRYLAANPDPNRMKAALSAPNPRSLGVTRSAEWRARQSLAIKLVAKRKRDRESEGQGALFSLE